MLENLQTQLYEFSDYSSLNDNLQYLDHISNNYKFNEVTVDPSILYRYQGNFLGLLKELNVVTSNLYLYTMYINNIVNPYDFDTTMTTLKIPIRPPIPVS
jgi:hypothetical protein